jgi:hypothetical protein
MLPAYGPPPLLGRSTQIYERDGHGYPPAERSSLKRRVATSEFMRMWSDARGAKGWGSRADFAEMFGKMRPGDEVWVYNTIGEVPLSGMKGLVLLRNGNVMAEIIFMRS